MRRWLWVRSGLRIVGTSVTLTLSQALHLEIFGDCQERIEVFLSNVDLAMVHEVEHAQQVAVLHPLEVEQGVVVGVPPQQ